MRKIHLFLIAAAFFCTAFCAVGAENAALIWKVTHKDKPGTMYLTGTIHIAKKSMFPLDAVYDSVIVSSDAVLFEIYKPSKMETLKYMVKYGLYKTPEKQNLETVLGKKYFDLLKSFLEKNNTSIQADQIKRMKPWVIMQLVQYAPLVKKDFNTEYGYEQIFTSIMDGREGRSLESVGLQVKVLISCPNDEIVKGICEILENENDFMDDLSLMINAFKNSDIDQILNLSKKDKEKYPGIQKLLLTERNKKMAEKLMAALDKPETLMVAVGCGHFVGDDSVNALLEEKGCTIERMKNSGIPGVLTLRAAVEYGGAGNIIKNIECVKKTEAPVIFSEEFISSLSSIKATPETVFNTEAKDFQQWRLLLDDGRCIYVDYIPSDGIWRQTDADGKNVSAVMRIKKIEQTQQDLFQD